MSFKVIGYIRNRLIYNIVVIVNRLIGKLIDGQTPSQNQSYEGGIDYRFFCFCRIFKQTVKSILDVRMEKRSRDNGSFGSGLTM